MNARYTGGSHTGETLYDIVHRITPRGDGDMGRGGGGGNIYKTCGKKRVTATLCQR